MSLKITKSTEPIEVKTITMCIYALPGIGRTSTGYTAEKPILFDFDKGAYRSKNRRDTILIEGWDDIDAMKPEDLAGYKTAVVDTVGRALDAMTVKLIRSNAKNGNGAGGLSLQGYGALKTTFIAWLNQLRSMGMDVVLLAHCDEQKRGDDILERLDIQGGSKNEVYKVCDAMGRIMLENRKRILNFSPSDTSFGKNPAQLDPIEVPNFATAPDFLAGVIAKTKAAINALSAEQLAAANLLAEWTERIEKASTVEDFNALIEPTKAADDSVRDKVKRLLVKISKARGFAFDTKAGAFTAPAAKPAEVQQDTGKPANDTSPAIPAAATASRGPGSDDDQADRKAAEPTAEEIAKIEAEKASAPELPGVGSKAAKKGKAA